jgi:hypothetical protein
VIFLLLYLLCCFAGGWLITAGVFRLRRAEYPMVGLAAGIVVEVWLANLLGRFLPETAAFWLACALTLLLGLVLALASRPVLPRLREIPWRQFAAFGLLGFVYFLIGRGLAIFDDYQNLPMVSLLAAGDIPPHFALDPAVSFGYHHFLLLFAAQVMRLGDLFPWNALDFARAVVFALAVLLAYNWGRRFTLGRAGAIAAAAFVALAGGMRWLLLLIPAALAPGFAANVHLIGSGQATAPDLITALRSSWEIHGGGPLPFPFAFANGLYRPLVMYLDGVGAMGVMLLILLLLTHTCWRGWRGAAITVIFLSSLALLLEVEFVLILAAFGLLLVVTWLRARRVYFPSGLRAWLVVGLAAALIAILQGGALGSLLPGPVLRAVGQQAAPAAYFEFGFSLAWPPSLISAHLGTLSLANPWQLVALLAEIGFILLVFPLVLIWGWKSLRAGRWFEAALIGTSVLSLLAVLIRYSGIAGESATLRLYGPFFKVCTLYAVPLVWVWARQRRLWVRAGALALGGLTLVGGLVMLGVQLTAIQRPVFSYFLFGLDAHVMREYYDRLEPDALIFDPVPFRAPAILGRPTDSSLSWYETKLGWRMLLHHPDPHDLNAAGFDYALIDGPYWDGLSASGRAALQDACARSVARYEGLRDPPVDEGEDFRWLLDLRACR